jgi:hypothetical protein
MSPPARGPIDVLAILSGEQDQAQLVDAEEDICFKWSMSDWN